MKNYLVFIPITGFLKIEVEAETQQEAEEKAWQEGSMSSVQITDPMSGIDKTQNTLGRWELRKKIMENGEFKGLLPDEISVIEV